MCICLKEFTGVYGSKLFDRGTYPVRYSDGGLAAFGSSVPAKGDGVVLMCEV